MDDEKFRATDNLQQELEAAKLEVTLLENKLEAVCSEKLHLLADKEDLKSKVEDSVKTEVDLRRQIAELIKENDNLELEKENFVKRIEEGKENVDDLKAKVEQLQVEKQNLHVQVEIQDAHTTGTLEHIKALEEENSSLKLRLDIVTGEKRVIDKQLTVFISEAKIVLKSNKDELSSLQGKLELAEKESTLQIEASTAKFNDLTQEINELQTEKSKLEGQITELRKGSIILEHELNTLRIRDREMKWELKRKTENIAEYLNKIQLLDEKLSSSDKFLKKYFHEKENLAAKLKELELDVEKLETHKAVLEDETRTKSDEASRLMEEIQKLENGIIKMEKVVQVKEEERATVNRRLEDQKIESRLKISDIVKEIDDLKLGSGEIQNMISDWEAVTEMTKQDYSESLKLLEFENTEMKNRTEELKDDVNQTMKQNLSKLEVEIKNHKEEKKKLRSHCNELKKRVAILRDEKLEAIRQLCLWSDDLQSRYYELKNMVSKSSLQRRQQ